jgi:hypothetical protein
MTTAAKFHAIDGGAGEVPARLRPADACAQKMASEAMVSQAADPFEISADTGKGPSMRDALVTGLLVIYPALATVAAIVAGLFLASANGT